ncbi:FYN-binding protein 1 isoform X3 [Alligator sinensis]|uniref:FYN-binding protein 1 n=1 Tax=Alligator sinensis TaxID=38654 RepID=A0A3Q0H6Y3_ALLSI|nr:FYN-binding protein 1 isoform X3 [Alligator sinensis]
MAKFNTGNNPAEDVLVNSRPFRLPEQSSGLQARKAALEKFTSHGNAGPPSGPHAFPKSASPKPPLGIKPPIDDKTDKDPKPPYLKHNPVAHRFGTPPHAANREDDGRPAFPKPLGSKPSDLGKEEPKPLFPKPPGNKYLGSNTQDHDFKPVLGPKPPLNSVPQHESEPKPVFPKIAGKKEKFAAAPQENDPKLPFPKPPLGQKPPLAPDTSHNEDASNRNVFLHKGPPGQIGPRPKGRSFRTAKETEENSNNSPDSPAGHFPNVALKPVRDRIALAPSIPKTGEEKTEEKRTGIAKNIFLSKMNQEDSGSIPPKFPKPAVRLAAAGPSSSFSEKEDGDKNSTTPKWKTLPPTFTVGPAPQKPSRPPKVDLERFRKHTTKDSPNKELCKQVFAPSAALSPPAPPPPHSVTPTPVLPPPPPASHPSAQALPAPSLPPRNIKASTETTTPDNEQSYDDVEFGSDGHGNPDGDQESDGEMYEDINDIRASSKEQEKKKEKEEKKRLDQEKKEQKEKEKKEQEIRKRFKLQGPIQVIHQAQACTDYKGGKNELTVKQGDQIEIIRITDNPEGKWLGRTKGSYGYIKTTLVEIDYDSLKRKQRPSFSATMRHGDSDQEVYDDVGEQDSSSSGGQSGSGSGLMFPPPPSTQEIYEGMEDEDVNISMSPSAKQFAKDSGGDSDVYDDVDSTDFPPPPVEISSTIFKKSWKTARGKSDEKDAQKSKRMEKEEKELRKKFKFEGDIRVLYCTTVALDLSSKKWGAKDLQVKPGESVEVIQSTDDTKVLCRNEEGKYGYVLRSNLVENDGEIYDDIADGGKCIQNAYARTGYAATFSSDRKDNLSSSLLSQSSSMHPIGHSLQLLPFSPALDILPSLFQLPQLSVQDWMFTSHPYCLCTCTLLMMCFDQSEVTQGSSFIFVQLYRCIVILLLKYYSYFAR